MVIVSFVVSVRNRPVCLVFVASAREDDRRFSCRTSSICVSSGSGPGLHLRQEHRGSGAVSSCVLSGGPQVGFGPFIDNANLNHLIEIQPPFPPALVFSLQETDPILFILSGCLWELRTHDLLLERVVVCYSHYSGAENVKGWAGDTSLRWLLLLTEHILLDGTRRPGLVPCPCPGTAGFSKI